VTARGGPRYILALDQGTTSSRAILFDRAGTVVASAARELSQSFPAPGHVEQDPDEIWETQVASAREALDRASAGPGDVAAIGITNQRETTIVWERETGRPVAPAIVWQSRVTADFCDELRRRGLSDTIRSRTGLPIDAYFSGPKIRHILQSRPGLNARAERSELAFGTVDTFLLWRLTGGRVHATDVTNASRTLLFDIHRRGWDDELLGEMGVPRAMLPDVRSSSEVFGTTTAEPFEGEIPIAGVAGDQQAATFGQVCFAPGAAKTTYGTGAFLLLNTGEQPVASRHGLLTTIAWQLGPDAPITYALEGSVFVAGAAVQWLRDGLRAIVESADVEKLAASAKSDDGLYLVPAFVGLGAPYWDERARGILVGLTRGTGLPEVARATVESIAYQVRDVVDAMNADTGSALRSMKADGGAAANDALLQFQADILDLEVERPVVVETTALGAAYLAGLAVGFWSGLDEITANWALDRRFSPGMEPGRRARLYRGWQRAVERSRSWAEVD
jgi:glycerol kinase